jgi:hypothetical protein
LDGERGTPPFLLATYRAPAFAKSASAGEGRSRYLSAPVHTLPRFALLERLFSRSRRNIA